MTRCVPPASPGSRNHGGKSFSNPHRSQVWPVPLPLSCFPLALGLDQLLMWTTGWWLLDTDRAAEIQDIAETETLIAAVDHLDEFSDTELVTLIGF
jgi:hypothetical protein